MGLVEPAEDVFIEQFLKRNQSIDASNRRTYQMYLSDMAACADLPDKIPYVGGKIYGINLAASGAMRLSDVFMPIPQADNPIDTFNQASALQNDTKITMRRADYVQASQPSRKETATAVDALVASGTRDVKQAVDFLNMSYHFPAWRKHLIYWDFFNGNQKRQTTNAEGNPVMIQAGEMNQAFEFSVDIAAALQRPIAMRRMIESAPYYLQAPETDRYWWLNTMAWVMDLPNRNKFLPPPDLAIAIIERENLALRQGIQLPVHPAEPHEQHIEGHTAGAQKDAQNPEFELTDVGITAYNRHIEEHNQFINQINNPAGTNTPKLSDANAGQLLGGASPGIKNSPLPTTTPG